MSDNLIETILEVITPEIYERFKTAIELRRWPNGLALTGEQMDTCMQAVVAYEYKRLPQKLRTGYVPPKPTPCADESTAQKGSEKGSDVEEVSITWR